MNNLQRTGGTAVQLWQALPTWGKVVTALATAIGLYYGFFFIVGLFFFAAMGVGMFTIVRWLMRR